MTASRLRDETSPYLRQHADNPVDWYPWGEDAFAKARAEDKPLFVSIGYASCHWCHVMAHESFEDPQTAADLSAGFVAVKVDREERPDVDAVYMASVQALTGSGGWPMSVFCLPDGRPFFAGTYFPSDERHGMPSFRHVLAALRDAWDNRRPEVEEQAASLVEAVTREVRLVDHLSAPADGDGALPDFDQVLDEAVTALSESFDHQWGGFGSAPKFPRPSLVDLCLWHHRRTGDAAGLAMATATLDAMAAGGMYDHLVGGFCRYSTDAHWMVPHFEKMLTDQALLARAYLHSWQLTGREAHLQVVRETLDYALDALDAPGGGLYSSEDADAAGVEGGHATFTAEEAQAALAAAGRPDLIDPVCDWYGITAGGNWEGRTVLHRPVGAPLQRPPEVEEGRQLLLAARRRRPQPALDDKVLTEWNAMAATALAEAAWATGDERWSERAEGILEFLFRELRRPEDGRWLRSWQGGRARHLALSTDHAWLVAACTAVAELTGRSRWLERATEVGGELLDRFWDPDTGGLFTTGHDAEPLVVRAKEVIDGAVPSAGSVGAWALLRLGALSGERRFTDAGHAIVAAAAPLLARHPIAVADLVPALALAAGQQAELVVTGDRPDLVEVAQRRWEPTLVVAWGEPTSSPLWQQRGDGLAYLCRGYACLAPTGDAGTLQAQLVAAGQRGGTG